MVYLALLFCLIIEAIAVWIYGAVISDHIVAKKNAIICFFLAYCILFVTHSIASNTTLILNLLLFIVLNVMLLLYVFQVPFLFSILHAFALAVVSALSEILVGSFFDAFLEDYWIKWSETKNLLLMAASGVVFFLLTMLIALIQKYSAFFLNHIQVNLILFALSIIGLLFVISRFFFAIINNAFDEAQRSIIVTCIVVLFLVFIFVILLFGIMNHLKKEEIKYQQHLQMNEDKYQFFLEMQNRDQSHHILLHDMKNHLNTILMLCDNTSSDRVSNYIKNLISFADYDSARKYTESTILNSILYRYEKMAMTNSVSFEVCSSNPRVNFISDMDMTSLFGNLLDNAIESAIDSSEKYITIVIKNSDELNSTIIAITNSCKDKRIIKNGIAYTSKKNKGIHGFGLLSIGKIVSKYAGTIQQYQDSSNLSFHTIIMLRQEGFNENSHLRR